MALADYTSNWNGWKLQNLRRQTFCSRINVSLAKTINKQLITVCQIKIFILHSGQEKFIQVNSTECWQKKVRRYWKKFKTNRDKNFYTGFNFLSATNISRKSFRTKSECESFLQIQIELYVFPTSFFRGN